jgi:hypothetical protein
MIDLYEYFINIRYYFVLESLVFLSLLVITMIKFGKNLQGKDRVESWSSPEPASKIYGVSAFLLWGAGAGLVLTPEKFLVIIGICLVIAALQLAFHVDLITMAAWWHSKTGKTMMGLGSKAGKNKHKQYLQNAKQRGKLCLDQAKNRGYIWRDKILDLQ